MEKKGIKKEVKIYFITPGGSSPDEASDCMKMAFQESKEADLSPQWIKENEYSTIPLSKNVVFVLQEFRKDSEVFKNLKSTKSFRLCGPMCLRSCLAESKAIPDNKSPVFTTAMRGVVVTASQVSVQVKFEIKEKVSFMGGIYMSNLSDSVTHLVTDAVLSAKYEEAAVKGLPILKVDWVDKVWQESQTRNIKATDPDLIAKYKCPVFFKMFIACSNLSKKERDEIKTLVTKHGGTFTPSMRQADTTLLVVKEPQGDKYKFARSWNLPCVNPSYIHDSVMKGYALPSKGYLIEPAVRCSTPTKEDDVANFTYNSDPSISIINFDTNKTHVDDTQVTNSTMPGSQRRQPQRSSGGEYTHILKTLTISDAKKSGSFVDGCKVFLSGFTGVDVEKLMRILSLGGATVFSELTESVSHMLLGEFLVDDMRALSALAQKPHVVSLEWLVASIKQRAPAAEEAFYCLETHKVVPEPPSPLSQKGMQLLKPQFDASETSKMPPPPEPPVNRKLFSEFLKENVSSPAKQRPSPVKRNNQSMNSSASQESIVPDLFVGKTFLIVGYPSEMTRNLEEAIESAGGAVVATNFKGVADYAVVPLDTPVPNVTAVEVVTYLWLDDCMDNKAVMEMQYYHQPFSVDTEKRPLADCCVSLSSYCGREKLFLMHLAEALGAVYQDSLAKVAKKKEDIELLPSTHLVCPKPEGKKFCAAARWGLSIVNKDWLLACARSNSKVGESSFVVSEETDTTTSTGYHSNPVTKNSDKTPDSRVINTPRPPKVESNSTLKTPSTLPVTDAEATHGIPSTPATSHRPAEPDTPFQTPALPHRAVNSLKRKSSAMTPDDQSPFHMSTPDTPYGQAIATPSADTKKRWKRFIDDFPSRPKSPPASPRNQRRQSTPLSELKRRAFAKALETSEESINPNYSIEEMEQLPDSGDRHSSVGPSHLREDASTSKSTPTSCNKSTKGNTSLKAAAAWSTPSASDFKSADGSSSSQKKGTDISPPEKRSLENEMVCKMLGQLQQRLNNTPNQSSEEKRVRPKYKELASYKNQTPTLACSNKPETNTILDPESQPVVIGWGEDPVETAERERMMTTSSSTSNKPRKFVLSNITDREEYGERLRSLGETVCEGAVFDLETTHLVVDKPVRSEKLLCCLAGGRWILHTSYIDRMMQCGKYVPEEEKYEWGNPLSSSRIPPLPPGDIGQELAQAAYRWRKQINGTSDGAFKGLRAMLFTTVSKCGSYQRLITAGGGTVLPSTLSSVSSATHCFIELNKVPNLSVPLSEFVAHNVPCVAPVFLGEMLTNPSPNIREALFPEYKKLLALKNK